MNELTQGQKNDNLMRAVRERCLSEVARMIEGGAAPDCLDRSAESPLYVAASLGFYEGADLLLKAGANPNFVPPVCRSPLFAAAGASPLIVRLLLQRGANPNLSSMTVREPLFNAVHERNPESVRLLLDAGAKVDVRNPSGETLLHVCTRGSFTAKGDRVEIARILVDAGADVNAEDKYGETVLSMAVMERHEAALTGRYEGLFDWLMTLQLSQSSLDRALVRAVEKGRTTDAERLIGLGADIMQRPNGKTLLQLARKGDIDTKRLLRSAATQIKITAAMSGGAADGFRESGAKGMTL